MSQPAANSSPSNVSLTKLLASRRFGPLFCSQFGGALNDNVLRNALVAMFTFGGIAEEAGDRALLVQLAVGLFILPFLLFSALAGRLADYCPDRRLALQVIKACEFATMVLAVAGFFFGNIPVLLTALFLTGVQSSYFGPFKYALLPTLLGRDELIAGNGMLNASTYIAILIGIFWGTDLGVETEHIYWLGTVLLLIAAAGFFFSLLLPPLPGAAGSSWDKAWSWNLPREMYANMAGFFKQREPALLVCFISWFWASGAIITTQLPIYVRSVAHFDHEVYLFLLLVICLGIASGSLLSIAVLRSKISTRWVPVSMCATAAPMLLLPGWPAIEAGAETGSLEMFFAAGPAIATSLSFAAISIGMGFYIVPLYACLQLAAPEQLRGRVIASNNIINSLLIIIGVLASGVIIGFFGELKLAEAMRVIFAFIGIVTILLAVLIWRIMPRGEFRNPS